MTDNKLNDVQGPHIYIYLCVTDRNLIFQCAIYLGRSKRENSSRSPWKARTSGGRNFRRIFNNNWSRIEPNVGCVKEKPQKYVIKIRKKYITIQGIKG